MDNFPIAISVSKEKMILDGKTGRGDNADILVYRNNTSNNQALTEIPNEVINMFATSSISKSGQQWTLSSKFSNSHFFLSNISYKDPYK